MKKITLLFCVFFALTACQNQASNFSQQGVDPKRTEHPSIGGDKDDHGYLIGAGQTWSELEQDCLQIFTVGLRLNPIENNDKAVISAFVLFNEDASKLELFLPEKENTMILDKVGEQDYQKESYRYTSHDSALYVDNTMRYKGE